MNKTTIRKCQSLLWASLILRLAAQSGVEEARVLFNPTSTLVLHPHPVWAAYPEAPCDKHVVQTGTRTPGVFQTCVNELCCRMLQFKLCNCEEKGPVRQDFFLFLGSNIERNKRRRLWYENFQLCTVLQLARKEPRRQIIANDLKSEGKSVTWPIGQHDIPKIFVCVSLCLNFWLCILFFPRGIRMEPMAMLVMDLHFVQG